MSILHCKIRASFKSYWLVSDRDEYEFEVLHVCTCRHPNCQNKEFMRWHGITYQGFTTPLKEIAKDDKEKWLNRLWETANNQISGPIVSEATREISKGAERNYHRVILRYIKSRRYKHFKELRHKEFKGREKRRR